MLNEVVDGKKPQLNLAAPPEVKQAFEDWCERMGVGRKQKWVYSTAAILLLMRLSPEDAKRLGSEIASADFDGSFARLVADATSVSDDDLPDKLGTIASSGAEQRGYGGTKPKRGPREKPHRQ